MKERLRNMFFDKDGERRVLRARYIAPLLLFLSAAVALMTLLLGAETYAALVGAGEKLLAYLRNPAIAALNLLPPLLLTALGWCLTRRAWAAYLFAVLPSLGFALTNLYKVALRGDPLLFTDLRLVRTAGGILSHYQLPYSGAAVGVGVCAAVLLALCLLVPKPAPASARTRLIWLLGLFAVAPMLLEPCYLSAASYAATENAAYITENSDEELYASRGFWYSFLHTVPDVFSAIPSNFGKRNAERIMSHYTDADIPEGQKVQIVGVMLEAFCDLSDYPMLAGHKGVQEVYEPLHELEARSVSGDIITNIFAGGTVESEWAFLTGYAFHGDFTADVDTYVRYFSDQGYETVFQHPGYSWFYDRADINRYLGFDRSVFSENGFADLVDPELAPYRSDGVLFDYLLDSLKSREPADAPLFSFSVSYQNHGPYGLGMFDGALVTPEETGWSRNTCGILSHYLYGIQNTIEEVRRFVDGLEALDEPVVLVLFGDHKPWLGNHKSVYTEMGVNFDLSTEEGLRNVYSTPYLIWANTAAKRTLGRDFAGDGGDFSPCLLMEELFDCCGWEGPAFMQLAREVRAFSPLLHWRGIFLVDGEYLHKDELPDDVLDFYLGYRDVEVWREQYGLAKEE